MKRKLLIAALLTIGTASAQEVADKKIQVGLGFSTGLNLNQAATKRMEVNGVGSAFSIGLNMNYSLSNTVALFTGLDVDFETNKIAPGSSEIGKSFYNFNDTKIIQAGDALATDDLYNWTSRTQKPIYLTIPTMVLFRTKFFGDLRYFGKFGLRTSFLLGNQINDEGFEFESNSLSASVASENNTMKASSDMNFIRSSIGLAVGTEWNFSGPTSLSVEIGYYYGFVPIYRSNSISDGKNKTLFFEETPGGTRTYYTNDMTQSQLQLKVAVLF